MKSRVHFLITALCIGSFIGCKSNPKFEHTSDSQKPTEEIVVVDEVQAEEEDDTLQEYGRILNIEHGAYPMFVVTVDFPKSEMQQDFNLNIEAVSGLSTSDLGGLVDNYATIFYTSELENNLLDIHSEQKTILGEYAPEFDATWKSITGILQDANEETMSDLPGEITIQDEDGKTMSFEIYITPEMVAVNGKEVTVYYYIRGKHTIIDITPARED